MIRSPGTASGGEEQLAAQRLRLAGIGVVVERGVVEQAVRPCDFAGQAECDLVAQDRPAQRGGGATLSVGAGQHHPGLAVPFIAGVGRADDHRPGECVAALHRGLRSAKHLDLRDVVQVERAGVERRARQDRPVEIDAGQRPVACTRHVERIDAASGEAGPVGIDRDIGRALQHVIHVDQILVGDGLSGRHRDAGGRVAQCLIGFLAHDHDVVARLERSRVSALRRHVLRQTRIRHRRQHHGQRRPNPHIVTPQIRCEGELIMMIMRINLNMVGRCRGSVSDHVRAVAN